MMSWMGTINKKFWSHHCMGQTLQFLLKPRMVFISSAVSSKSNTCIEINISQGQQLTCKTHANNSSTNHLDVLLDTPRCDWLWDYDHVPLDEEAQKHLAGWWHGDWHVYKPVRSLQKSCVGPFTCAGVFLYFSAIALMVGSSNKEGSSGLALQVRSHSSSNHPAKWFLHWEHNGSEMITDQGRSGEPSGLYAVTEMPLEWQ